jgi:uncharacterized protein (DUF1501 family)
MSDSRNGINGIARRDFVKAGLAFGVGAAALGAGYAAVPDAFARAIYEAKRLGSKREGVLVMIQLAGGNDGLRTVVPVNDPRLHDLRPQLAAASVPKALPIGPGHGLNHNLKRLKKLWDRGKMAIVEGVGYPDPSLSHFESIRVWETGDPSRRQLNGWLGRTLSRNYDSYGHPLTGCSCGVTATPGTLRDMDSTVAVIESQQAYGFIGEDVEATVGAVYRETPGMYGALFDTSVATLRKTIAEVRRAIPDAGGDTVPSYSQDQGNQLAQALKLSAQLILAGTGVRLLHVTLDGFDTHYTELSDHDQLMTYLDEALGGFYNDLAKHGRASEVLVATWSEFGRRPQENVSVGTDHGTAAPVLLVGDPVAQGVYGQAPDLRRLDDDGNLRYSTDFRSVYQEILDVHLGADSRAILGQRFERVPFLSKRARL